MSEKIGVVRRAPVRRLRRDERRRGRRPLFRTAYAIPRLLVAWALRFGEDARIVGPPELVEPRRASGSTRSSSATAASRSPCRPTPGPPRPAADGDGAGRSRGGEAGIRPERFARLVTLASVLIAAGREERRLPVAEVCEQLQISEQELREDVSVLNVVNFGGGAYVIYAEVLPSGEIEVDPEPYSDTFDRPAAPAADRGQRAGGGDRPDRPAPRPRRARRPRARRSSPRSGTTRSRRACASPRRPRRTTSRARSSAPCTPAGGWRSSTGRRTRTRSPSA